MNIVQDIWRYANLAYKEPRDNSNSILSGSIVTPMNNVLDYGFIAEFHDRVIISFRGTKGKVESWLSDFDSFPVISIDGGTVHEGFYKGWRGFENPITDYIRNNVTSLKPIFCTGHSRGGAIATLCSVHLSQTFQNPISNINFGSPAVGKSDFRDQYEYLPIYTTRIINGYDLVPNVPLWDMGFRHIGNLTTLYQPYWHKYWHKIRDHYPENYQIAINKWKIKV